MKNKHHWGFTLMEVMITVAILAVIATFSVSSFGEFSRRQALDAGAEALAGGLRDARARTLASAGGMQYGVAVEEDGFVLFQGQSYLPETPENDLFLFSAGIKASTTSSLFVFQRLTGDSSASGTIDVYMTRSAGLKRSVTVSGTGLVGIQ